MKKVILIFILVSLICAKYNYSTNNSLRIIDLIKLSQKKSKDNEIISLNREINNLNLKISRSVFSSYLKGNIKALDYSHYADSVYLFSGIKGKELIKSSFELTYNKLFPTNTEVIITNSTGYNHSGNSKYFTNASVFDIRQKLFHKNREKIQLDINELNFVNSSVSNDQASINLINEITEVYFNYIRQEKKLNNLKARLERSRKQLEFYKSSLSLGKIDELMYNRLLLSIKQLELDINNNETIKNELKEKLENIVGAKIEELETETKEWKFDTPEKIDISKNNEVIADSLNYIMSKKERESVEIVNSWDLYAGSKINVSSSGNGISGIFDNQNIDTWSIYLALEWPILNGGSKKNEIEKARKNEKKALLQYEKTKQNIEFKIKFNIEKIINKKKNIEKYLENYEIAEKNLHIAEKQFWFGNISYSDYSRVEDDYAAAWENYIDAIIDYNLEIINIYKLVGYKSDDLVKYFEVNNY